MQPALGQFNESVWDYPVKPGTEEWKRLKTHAEKVSVCQLPDTLLISLNTKELLEICYNYPLLMNIMAFNSIQFGIDNWKRDFNGIRELLGREDFKDAIIEKYTNFNPSGYDKDWSLAKKGGFSFKIMVVELLIGQQEVIDRLTPNEKQDLVRILLSKMKDKLNSEIYGISSYMTTCFAISRIILSEKPELIISEELKTEIQEFSNFGDLNNSALLPEIILIANKFAYTTDQILNGPRPNDIRMDVYTPLGNPVEAWITEEDSPASRAYYDNEYRSVYDSTAVAEFYTTYDGFSSTRRFNCHGFAWYMASAEGSYLNDPRWIGLYNAGDEEIYMTDGSYKEVDSETYPGKVSWANGDHSAITTFRPGFYISKWGYGPLVEHYWDYSPYGNNPELKFYKLCFRKIENKTYTTNITRVDCKLEFKNVTIQNNSVVDISFEDWVRIEGPFDITLGATLNITPILD